MKKNKVINIKISENDFNLAKKLAKDQDLTLSEYIRRLIIIDSVKKS